MFLALLLVYLQVVGLYIKYLCQIIFKSYFLSTFVKIVRFQKNAKINIFRASQRKNEPRTPHFLLHFLVPLITFVGFKVVLDHWLHVVICTISPVFTVLTIPHICRSLPEDLGLANQNYKLPLTRSTFAFALSPEAETKIDQGR